MAASKQSTITDGEWVQLSETELKYKEKNSDGNSIQRIQKQLGDTVDNEQKVSIREISRDENMSSLDDYANTPKSEETAVGVKSTNLKDRVYTKMSDNKYSRQDIQYEAKTKGNIDIGVNGSTVNYDVDINDESVAKNNQDLLEIFDQGINNIVLKLKSRFGKNNKEINDVVNSISGIFGSIDEIINDKDRLGTDSYAEDDYSSRDSENKLYKTVSKKNDNTGEYTSTIQNNHDEEKNMKAQFNHVKTTEFKDTLDSDYNYTSINDTNELDLNKREDKYKLKLRLDNCQALEIFHLKLFENFMKTGAFTLTLYEKYKYITTVMLYLLKNLVNKPKLDKDCSYGERTAIKDTVTLPKTVIKNIGRLVEEQNRIQGTIDTISTSLKATKLDDIYGYANYALSENLKDKDTPNKESVPGYAKVKTDLSTQIDIDPHTNPDAKYETGPMPIPPQTTPKKPIPGNN